MKGTRCADYQAALRVVKAIEDRKQPSWEDALALRLSSGKRARLRPLGEIAKAIVRGGNMNHAGVAKMPVSKMPVSQMPDITKITGPDTIVFWANSRNADLWMRQCYSTGPKLNFALPGQKTDALAFVGRANREGFSINVTG
jgi:hypothetical protein